MPIAQILRSFTKIIIFQQAICLTNICYTFDITIHSNKKILKSIPMADICYPNEVFRFANVRAPQKHIEADYPARYVDYNFATPAVLSAFTLLYETLVTHRTGANSRTIMYNDCVAYKANSNYIASLDVLYSTSWFNNFRKIDDYLRTKQAEADKTELITVIEAGLGQTINSYVTASGFLAKKVNLWDNLFAQIILAENSPLRTEILRVIRLLQLIERLNGSNTFTSYGMQDGFIVKSDAITGIGEKQANPQNQLIIYTNPNKGTFTIKVPDAVKTFKDAWLYVYDITGKETARFSLDKESDTPHFNVSKAKAGSYNIKLIQGDKVYFGEMIVQ